MTTIPETNSSHLKIDPKIKGDSYWKPPFLGAMLVSGRVVLFPQGHPLEASDSCSILFQALSVLHVL